MWWFLACTEEPEPPPGTGSPDGPQDHTGARAPTGDTGGHSAVVHTADTGAAGDPRCDTSPGQEIFAPAGRFTDLQFALDTAGPGDTLVACRGTWTGAFVAAGPVTLRDGDAAGDVVLDGGGLGTTFTTAGDTVLEGLELTGGEALDGGGVRSAEGALALLGCTIWGNHARNGGGVWALGDRAALVLDDTTVRDNTADDFGGGLYVDRRDVAIRGGEVRGNTALSGGGAALLRSKVTGGAFVDNTAERGGGLWVEFTDVDGATASGNLATLEGGGAALQNTGLLDGVVLQDNTAPTGGGLAVGWGSGGYYYGGLAVLNARIAGNHATDGGGVGSGGGYVLYVADTVVDGNDASGDGGGFHVTDGQQLQLVGGAVTANTAAVGGGVWSDVARFAIDAQGVDFGGGATDNTPDDVAILGGSYAFGAAATFDCEYLDDCH